MAHINIGAKLGVAGAVLSLLAFAGASWFNAIPVVHTVINSPATAKTVPSVASGKAIAVKPALSASEKPLWSELSTAQQQALMPLSNEWDKLESIRKQKWLKIANRYFSMKPVEQRRVQKRMYDWIKLRPEQRRVARANYARAKKNNPSQNPARWVLYQQLPGAQKKKLAGDAAMKKQVANLPSKAQSKIKLGFASAHPLTVQTGAPTMPIAPIESTAPASPAVPASNFK